jgi:hypothetical protein
VERDTWLCLVQPFAAFDTITASQSGGPAAAVHRQFIERLNHSEKFNRLDS